jgi:hypothetical protein
MSQFPALKPSSRSYQHASLPVSSFTSLSGKETRVLLGDTFHGATLTLSFEHLQESVSQQLMDHFAASSGTLLSFTLPAAVWAGWANYTATEQTDKKWRYTGPPSVAAVSPGIMTVSVELISLA